MKTLAVIQARMGSSRLPGKVLADVCGKPLLWYVVHRAQLATRIDRVIVATPDTPADLEIHAVCASWGVDSYAVACDERDVLTRYTTLAAQLQADRLVRLTADCPLTDPDVIDGTIEQLTEGTSWASNIQPRTWPDGLDVEVVTSIGLQTLDALTTDPTDREHVTPALYRQPQLFGIGGAFLSPVDLSAYRWTVDTQADLDWIRQVYRRVSWRANWQQILFSGIEQRRVA